jgi:hypothetical protein
MAVDLNINLITNTADIDRAIEQLEAEIVSLSGKLANNIISNDDKRKIVLNITELKKNISALSDKKIKLSVDPDVKALDNFSKKIDELSKKSVDIGIKETTTSVEKRIKEVKEIAVKENPQALDFARQTARFTKEIDQQTKESNETQDKIEKDIPDNLEKIVSTQPKPEAQSVKATVDTSEVQDELSSLEAEPINIPIDADITNAQTEIDSLEAQPIDIPVDTDVSAVQDEFSSLEAQPIDIPVDTDVSAVQDELSSLEAQPIDIPVDTDVSAVQGELDSLETQPIDIPITGDVSEVQSGLDSLEAQPIDIPVDADVSSIQGELDSLEVQPIDVEVTSNINDIQDELSSLEAEPIDIPVDTDISVVQSELDSLEVEPIEVQVTGDVNEVQLGLDSLEAQPIDIPVDADISSAQGELDSLETQPIEIQVTGDVSEVQSGLDSLEAQPIDIPVDTDISQAQSELDSLEAQPIDIPVDTDVSEVQSELDSLEAQPIEVQVAGDVSEVQSGLDSLEAQPIDIPVNTDVSEVQSELDSLEAQSLDIPISADTTEAQSNIDSLEAEPIEIPVGADTAEAQDELDSLEAEPIEVPVDVDTERAKKSIRDLLNEANAIRGILSSSILSSDEKARLTKELQDISNSVSKTLLDPEKLNQSLRDLKLYRKELQGSLGNAIFSQEDQQKISTRLAEVNGKIQDLDASTRKFDPNDTFGNFATLIGVGNTSLVALTNSLELFGVKNEDVQGIQDKLNKLMQLGIVLQQIADADRLKGMVVYYRNKVKELVIEKLSFKEKVAQAGATKTLTAAQLAWNKAVMANPIMLLVTAILALVAVGVTLYNMLKDNTEQTYEYEKALDGTIIKNEELRESHNKAIIELKKLEIEYGLLTGAITETDAAILQLSLDNQVAMKEIADEHEKALVKIEDDTNGFWTRAWEFLTFTKHNETKLVKQTAEENIAYQQKVADATEVYNKKLLNILEKSQKQLRDLNTKTQTEILNKRIDVFNKTIAKAKEEFTKVKEYTQKLIDLNKQRGEIEKGISNDFLTDQEKKKQAVEDEYQQRIKGISLIKDETDKYQALLDLSKKRLESEIKLARVQYQSLISVKDPYQKQIDKINETIAQTKKYENALKFGATYADFYVKETGKVVPDIIQKGYDKVAANIKKVIEDLRAGKIVDIETALREGISPIFTTDQAAGIALTRTIGAVIESLSKYTVIQNDLSISLEDAKAKQADWNNKLVSAQQAVSDLNDIEKELNGTKTSDAKPTEEQTKSTNNNTDAVNANANAIKKQQLAIIDLEFSIQEASFRLQELSDKFNNMSEFETDLTIKTNYEEVVQATRDLYSQQVQLAQIKYQGNLLSPEYILEVKKLTKEEADAIQAITNKFIDLQKIAPPRNLFESIFGTTTQGGLNTLARKMQEKKDEILDLNKKIKEESEKATPDANLIAEWGSKIKKAKGDIEDIGNSMNDIKTKIEEILVAAPGQLLQVFVQQQQNEFATLSKYLDDFYAKQSSNIDKLLEQEKISEQEATDMKKKNEEEYAKKKRDLEIKQFKFDKKAALFEIAINTAIAITKSLPNVVLAGLAAIQGGIQAAVVASQPLPTFKKGGYGGLLQGPSHAAGGVMTPYGVAEGGEFIVNKQQTQKNAAVLETINNTDKDMIAELSNRLDNIAFILEKPSRSFVVESDITRSQKEVSKIKRKAYV